MSSFFRELKRRNVIRVAIAYIIVAWLLLQVVDVVVPILALPDSVGKLVLLLMGIGFPLALIFAWAFELTPEGLKREKDVVRDESITTRTGRKLDRTIIVVLVVALGLSLYANFSGREETDKTESIGNEDADRSFAVLPFTNRSADQADAFFVDGIHDELLTQLAKIGSLKVISRTSVMEYRDTTKKIPEIAEELGVANILEGGVQRAGDRVRIFAQLINAATDEHAWAETYDRELTVNNLLEIQSEIARSIATALHATLSPEEDGQLDRRMTDDLPAYEAYLRAQSLRRTEHPEARQTAIDELLFALERDPEFAAGWAELAYAYLQNYWFIDPTESLRNLAREAIDKGRAIEPDLVDLDVSEGYYHYWGFRDYDKALQALERAAKVAPGDVEVISLIGYINRRQGKFEEMLSAMKRRLELDPRQADTYFLMAETHQLIDRWPEMVEALQTGLLLEPTSTYGNNLKSIFLIERERNLGAALDLFNRYGVYDALYSNFGWWIENVRGNYDAALGYVDFDQFTETKFSILPPERQRGLTYLYSGDMEAAERELHAAREMLEQRRDENPDNPRPYRSLCVVYGGLGMTDEARRACDKAVETFSNDAYEVGFLRVEVAKGLALGGLIDQALDMIELYLTEPSGYGPTRTELEPAFRGLHDHPRFKQLIKESGSGKREAEGQTVPSPFQGEG